MAIFTCVFGQLQAQQAADVAADVIAWEPLKIRQSAFPRMSGMLDSEREQYATNLAGLAINLLHQAKPGKRLLMQARRWMAVALHLSPRNKRALVANFQLAQGITPDAVDVDYRPQSFARLLVTRAQLLEKQGGEANGQLIHVLVSVAADLDPKNEDAVYLSEVKRLDWGECDWSTLTNPMAGGSGGATEVAK